MILRHTRKELAVKEATTYRLHNTLLEKKRGEGYGRRANNNNRGNINFSKRKLSFSLRCCENKRVIIIAIYMEKS